MTNKKNLHQELPILASVLTITLLLTLVFQKDINFWLKGFPIYIGGFIGYLLSEHLPKGALKIFLVICVIILAAAFNILLYLH